MSGADIGVAIALGLLAGALSGLLGVGGGFVMVPGMVILLGQSQHIAQGTSLVVIIPTALVGTFASARLRPLPWRAITLVGVGGAVGAVLGVLIALNISEATLKRIFGVLLIVVAVRMVRHTQDHDRVE